MGRGTGIGMLDSKDYNPMPKQGLGYFILRDLSTGKIVHHGEEWSDVVRKAGENPEAKYKLSDIYLDDKGTFTVEVERDPEIDIYGTAEGELVMGVKGYAADVFTFINSYEEIEKICCFSLKE